MFITKEEMRTVMYGYQLDEITEGDDTIIIEGIATAVNEVKGYLSPNLQHKFRDGRLVYDTDAIFNASGEDRNPLIKALTKTCAEWWICQLSNSEVVYEQIKERYDRAIQTLNRIKNGEMNLHALPQLDLFSEENPQAPQLFYGSRKKFNHE